MSLIKFQTGAGKTDIYIPGQIETIEKLASGRSIVLLVDENVVKFHRKKISSYPIITIPEGEKSKSLEFYDFIFQELLDLDVDKSWMLIGIGGGIATDLAGFVACTYFRGIDFAYVSTTLLGQVDAAIGGKNGINYKGYKNLIGVIRQPEFVICDTETLKTLARKEFIGGFSEIIKYAFIRRKDLYPYLINNIQKAIEFDKITLEYLIEESIKTKVDIVEGDEFEKGDRKLLNFGHTFGHALEKLYGISHGEAVAIGMMLAAKTSVNLGMIRSDVVSELENLLILAGLPVSMDFDAVQLADAMKKDKKRRRESIDFILLDDIGNAVITPVPLSNLIPLLNDLR
jgi:3-dehydroquinate synthase